MNVRYPHQFSSLHYEDIIQSKTCGCFHCLKKFNSSKITAWIDNEQTALCPFCGIDSVIGDKSIQITEELLIAMKKYWF